MKNEKVGRREAIAMLGAAGAAFMATVSGDAASGSTATFRIGIAA